MFSELYDTYFIENMLMVAIWFMVRDSARYAEDPWFESALIKGFSIAYLV